MATSRRIGIEVDGNHATVVEVEGTRVVEVSHFQAASPQAATAAASSGLRKGTPVRVSLLAPQVGVRRIDVTRRSVEHRSVFEDAVFEALPVAREGTAVAGLLPTEPLVGEALGTASATVAPADLVNQVYRALGRSEAELVTGAFTLAGHDGVHLALRWTTAELTVVAGELPVLHRALQVGGLERVAETLDRAAGGADRVGAIIAGRTGQDPVAENEVDRYITAVASEVAQTVDHWERAGTSVSHTLWVFGPGATIPFVDDRLRGQGFETRVPDDVLRSLAIAQPQERPALAGAWLAATSVGNGMPAAAFVNPLALAKEASRRSSEKSARTLGLALAGIAIIAAVWFGPGLFGKRQVANAKANLTSAQESLSAVSADSAKVDQLKKLNGTYLAAQASDSDWAKLIDDITANLPANTTVASIGFQPGEGMVAVTVAVIATAPPPGPISAWISKVSADPIRGTGAWSPGFSYSGDTLTFSINFNVPSQCLLTPRPNAPADVTPPASCPPAVGG